jgi:hypothetical protein
METAGAAAAMSAVEKTGYAIAGLQPHPVETLFGRPTTAYIAHWALEPMQPARHAGKPFSTRTLSERFQVRRRLASKDGMAFAL